MFDIRNCLLLDFFPFKLQDKGHSELYNHDITLNADRYTITDKDSIPTGRFQPVSGTDYDLRVEQNLGKAITRLPNAGYDDNFCVTRGSDQSLAFVARYLNKKIQYSVIKYA